MIAAHLTGAVHACACAGPDPSPVLAQEAPHGATGTGGTPPGQPPPAHRHATNGHLDHTADRPRAALDDTGLGGEAHQPLLPTVSGGRFAPTPRRPASGALPACENGSPFAFTCVLRQ